MAMEATGIYWLCPYEVLEKAGLEVVVVNGKYVKNLPGRKTDMSDCQWQATLHAHGLLKPGFVPPEHIRRLQDYLRLRTDHITMAGSHEQHMQKALERMNLKIHDVISDLTGMSGLKMVEAILAGRAQSGGAVGAVRSADSEEEGGATARRPWRGPGRWNISLPCAKPTSCGSSTRRKSPSATKPSKRCSRNWPGRKIRKTRLHRPPNGAGSMRRRLLVCTGCCGGCVAGKDPTTLPGVADYVLLQLLAEVGTDLGKNWKTEKHFTAWLGLAPGSRQSGKRRGSQKRSRNRAGRLFCVIARSVGRSVDKALGGFYRRLKGRRGGLVANLALARKLAELFWRLMVHGIAYVEQGLKKYEDKVAQTEQRLLQKLARKYNLVLQPKAA